MGSGFVSMSVSEVSISGIGNNCRCRRGLHFDVWDKRSVSVIFGGINWR